MHTPYYTLALLYAVFSLVSSIRPIWLRTPNMAPYALKGQKLLAQGNTLGINGHKPVAL